MGTASGVLRNRKTANRTRKGEEYETHCTTKFRKTPHPQAAATEYYPLTDDEGGELSAGVRPALLEEGRPQGTLQRHAGIGYEFVQSLDVPVPQMVENLPNIVQFFAAQLPVVAEPVIEVPKILPHDVPLRRLCRDTQLAEQLVEVPTIVSYLILHCSGLWSKTSTSSSWSWRANRWSSGFFSRTGFQQRCVHLFLSGLWSRSSIFPVEAFKIFAQDKVHPLLRTFQLVLMMLWMRLVMVFFRTFRQMEACERISRIFSVTANSNPEVDSLRACEEDELVIWRRRQAGVGAHHTGDAHVTFVSVTVVAS